MSNELIIGILLQTIAVLLVTFRVRYRKLAYSGLIFICISIVYSGITEFVQIAFPGMNLYRKMANQDNIQSWVLLVSIAILLFSIAYSLRLRPIKEKREMFPSTIIRLVNWRWGIWIVIILNIYVAGVFVPIKIGYWGGLIIEMLPGFTIFVMLQFILEKKGKYLIPILLFQAGIGVLSGFRSAVLFSIITLLCVFIRYGIPIRWPSIIFLGTIAMILILSISGMRYAVGRDVFSEQTNINRIESIWSGVRVVFRFGIPFEIIQDIVYRFDGNSFGGLLVDGFEAGIKPAGWTPIINNIFLAVPSFLNPKKLEAGVISLNEEDYLINHFNLSDFHIIERDGVAMEQSDVDFIPGVWGILYGAFGQIGLIISSVLLGWGFAAVDSWINRTINSFSVLIGIGLTIASLSFEQGLRVFALTGRAIFALFILLLFIKEAKILFGLGSQSNKKYSFII